MSVMALAQKDLEIVTEHIQKAFPMLLELSSSDLASLRNNHVLEHSVREEEPRHQREILETIIHQMDKRFTEAREDINRRFEETNQQIKESREETNRRFEQMLTYVDKQIKESREETNQRFEETN